MDFSHLFETVDTITPGVASGIFTPAHFVVLSLILLSILFIARYFRQADAVTRERLLRTVAVFAIANEILKDVYLLALGQLQWANLPLHLCGINIIVIGLYLVKRSPKTAEWLYAIGLPGGLVALISPDWADLPVVNIMFWQANSIHAALVLFPILLLIDGFRPRIRRLFPIIPWLLGLAAIIFPLNKLLDTNFLFLNEAPKGTPFEVFEQLMGNPGYIAAFAGLLAVVWVLMYWPWRETSVVGDDV